MHVTWEDPPGTGHGPILCCCLIAVQLWTTAKGRVEEPKAKPVLQMPRILYCWSVALRLAMLCGNKHLLGPQLLGFARMLPGRSRTVVCFPSEAKDVMPTPPPSLA